LQLPIASWHELLSDPTMADAILDRVLHYVSTKSTPAQWG
jgi:hypothetical protein